MNKPEVIKEAKIAVYNEFRSQLEQLAADNAALVFDYEDSQGMVAAKAHIKTLKKTKTALEKVRKAEKQESLDYGRLVDSESKEIAAKIDDMIAVHETPLKEIEAREEARKDELKRRVRAIQAYAEMENATAHDIRLAIESLDREPIDASFQEYKSAAALAKVEAQEALGVMLEDAIEREKLAAEAAEREAEEKKAREAEIAKNAAAKAKQDAENAAKREREKIEAAHAAELKRIADEKAREEAAHATELKRIADKKAADEAEEARLKADIAHRESIHSEITNWLLGAGVNDDDASHIVDELSAGNVPHVSINYRG